MNKTYTIICENPYCRRVIVSSYPYDEGRKPYFCEVCQDDLRDLARRIKEDKLAGGDKIMKNANLNQSRVRQGQTGCPLILPVGQF